MSALYVLVDEYRAAADKLADLDMDEATIADTLESLSGELELKATNVAFMARNLDALGTSIDDAVKQMQARSKAAKNRAASLRRYLLDSMQRAQIQKITGPYFTIAQRENPPSVVIDDPAQLPAEYWRQKPPPEAEPDKAKIAEAIKYGTDVPGAHVQRGVRLDIK